MRKLHGKLGRAFMEQISLPLNRLQLDAGRDAEDVCRDYKGARLNKQLLSSLYAFVSNSPVQTE